MSEQATTKTSAQITTRADALEALDCLTARERAAVRVLLALAWCDGAEERERPGFDGPVLRDTRDHAYARRALPPRTVTRPRVVADPHSPVNKWEVIKGSLRPFVVRWVCDVGSSPHITPERAAIIADLLANPTETVEVADPHSPVNKWEVIKGSLRPFVVRCVCDVGSSPHITPERAAIIADLLANPTETVEVEE